MSALTVIYTDGSCIRVGKKDCTGGVGIYFGEDDPRNTSSLVPGLQTNNRAEVWAVICALQIYQGNPVEIKTDSQLTIKCATKQWTAKQNLDLYEILWNLMKGRDIRFTWVKGHAQDEGNIAADKLARDASRAAYKKKLEHDAEVVVDDDVLQPTE